MTSFWIFIAIVVIQAVVGGIAKSAEKRKKREAQQKLALEREARPTDAVPPTQPSKPGEVEIPVVARRIAEMLGATIEAGTGVSVGTTPSTAKPPRAIDEAVRVARQRRVEALRQRQARAAGSPPPPPPSVTPRTMPSAVPNTRPETVPPPVQASAAKSEAAKASPGRATRPAPAAIARTTGKSTSTSRVAGMLRNPQSVRDAVLLAELLREPVALRRSAPGAGF